MAATNDCRVLISDLLEPDADRQSSTQPRSSATNRVSIGTASIEGCHPLFLFWYQLTHSTDFTWFTRDKTYTPQGLSFHQDATACRTEFDTQILKCLFKPQGDALRILTKP